MVSYTQSLNNLFSNQAQALSWCTGPINIQVATSTINDTPKTINLSATIGHRKNVPKALQRSDQNCYWLPSNINTNNDNIRQKVIHPLFVRACHHAGFILHGRYDARIKAIVFQCRMGLFHHEDYGREYRASKPRDVLNPDEPPIERSRRSQRPVKDDEEDSCKVRFCLYWCERRSRWFLPHQQRGNLHHCGHLHVDPSQLRIQSRFVPRHEIKVAKDALDVRVPSTSTASLLYKRTGLGLEWHQLQYLKTKDKNELVMQSRQSMGGHVTAADRLLAQLDNDPTTTYVCLFGEYNSGLLTVKLKKKNLDKPVEESIFDEDLEDETDSPEQFAEDCCRAALTQTSTGRLLLAIGWTNDEARRKFDMFPEFIGGDDTEQTNSEDRPLYTLMSKDNNDKAFGHTWILMPAKSLWMFNWIYRTVMPVCHPGTAISRIELINADADPQMNRAIESVIGRSLDTRRLYPRAHGRNCAFHKINRNFTESSDYKSMLVQARKESVEASIEIDLIVRWMWYLIKYYENDTEVDFAIKLFKHYLSL